LRTEERSGEAKARRKSNTLVSMFSYSRCRFEKEGLFRRNIVEEELLYGCFSASALSKIETGDRTRVRGGETDPCWPKRRIFVHWRLSVPFEFDFVARDMEVGCEVRKSNTSLVIGDTFV
jgi:hypothetical protein